MKKFNKNPFNYPSCIDDYLFLQKKEHIFLIVKNWEISFSTNQIFI